MPTSAPTFGPTVTRGSPTGTPTQMPTKGATTSPTASPTLSPTSGPPPTTPKPTSVPTKSATVTSGSPSTSAATSDPTEIPTYNPSNLPTTSYPTEMPTFSPSKAPTSQPTSSPSSKAPTTQPTGVPTDNPTFTPSTAPTTLPSKPPTQDSTDLDVFMSLFHNNDSGSGGRRRLAVSNVLIDVTEKVYATLREFVQGVLAQHNVLVTDIEPFKDSELCSSSTNFNACTVVRVAISASFDRSISKCEIEYLITDYLGSVAGDLFAAYNVKEFWPQMGRSYNQFHLAGVDRPPNDKEAEAFEVVVQSYLADAFKNDEQPMSSICVEVVNTDFVDDGESSTAVVMARSAPITDNTAETKVKPNHRSPRSRNDDEEVDSSLTSSSYENVIAGTNAYPTDTKYDVFERPKATDEEPGIMAKRRPPRPRPEDEGYNNVEAMSPPSGIVTERSIGGATGYEGEYEIPPPKPGPRPKRDLKQQENLRRVKEEKRTVKIDTVVTGRYRGPKVDVERKVNDAISGNEYEIAQELEKKEPNYYQFDEDGEGEIELSLIVPSTTSSPTASPPILSSITDKEERKSWKGMTGFMVLGSGLILLSLIVIRFGWRRMNDDEDVSESSFSLQSIFVVPTCNDNSSTIDSTTSSLSMPQTTSTPSTLISILRKEERSILNKMRSSGTRTRRHVRWALDMDEKSGSSKNGDSNSGSAPGAYSVRSDSSDSISAGKLSNMWRKEGGHKGDAVDERLDIVAKDDTDEEEGMMPGSSTGDSGSFAQFSVYGTALMCKQEDDMTITTDLYGTALLMEDDVTVTTDNRSLHGQHCHGYIDEDEGL